MRNAGFLKISLKNILKYRLFSIFVVLILGIIFGISTAAINYVIKENSEKISIESTVTDAKVLMAVNLCESDYLSGACEVPETYDEIVLKTAKKYNGETIGARITYLNAKNEKIYVILARAGKYLNGGKAYLFADGKIPVLKNSDEEIDENIYQIFKEYSSDNTPFYIMMDDTMTVMNFVFANGFMMKSYEPLTIFDDEEYAYDFYKQESNENFKISQIFNSTILAKEKFDKSIILAIKLSFIILGVAIIILTIFCIIVSIGEKSNNQLYRTFGATKKDIFGLYLLSGAELFVLSGLVTPIVYLITMLFIS